jgi:hypothetical protein
MKNKLIMLLMAVISLCSIKASDFNHDGHQDYLLANPTTRRLAIWHLNGASLVSGVYGPTLPAGWSLVDTGDFNRDGYPDLLLYNPVTHGTAIWYLRDGQFLGGVYGPTFINGYIPKAVDDLDFDTHPDIIAFQPATGQLFATLMNNNNIKTSVTMTSIPQSNSAESVAAFDAPPQPTSAEADGPRVESSSSPSSPQVGAPQFPMYKLPAGWVIKASVGHKLFLLNVSTFQTATWEMGWNPVLPNPLPITSSYYGPKIALGYRFTGVMDFNLDGWNDYLLGGNLGVNAQWYTQRGTLVGGKYGPKTPVGYSFASDTFPTCGYGVAPTQKTVPAGGGWFLVNVVTEFGCPWYWHSNTAGITVSTGLQPRHTSGGIVVTVSPAAPPSGSVTVAGVPVLITKGSGGLTGFWTGSVGVPLCPGPKTTVLVSLNLVQSGNI